MTCCGDNVPFIYKRSKNENSLTDRLAHHVLKHQKLKYKSIPFSVGVVMKGNIVHLVLICLLVH